jgi:hypothetical protein
LSKLWLTLRESYHGFGRIQLKVAEIIKSVAPSGGRKVEAERVGLGILTDAENGNIRSGFLSASRERGDRRGCIGEGEPSAAEKAKRRARRR